MPLDADGSGNHLSDTDASNAIYSNLMQDVENTLLE